MIPKFSCVTQSEKKSKENKVQFVYVTNLHQLYKLKYETKNIDLSSYFLGYNSIIGFFLTNPHLFF